MCILEHHTLPTEQLTQGVDVPSFINIDVPSLYHDQKLRKSIFKHIGSELVRENQLLFESLPVVSDSMHSESFVLHYG